MDTLVRDEVVQPGIVKRRKAFYSINEACTITGLKRSTFYVALKQYDIKIIKFGKRTLLPEESIDELIEIIRGGAE